MRNPTRRSDPVPGRWPRLSGALLIAILIGCGPGGPAVFCDPDHGVGFELPPGWEPELRREQRNLVIVLRTQAPTNVRELALTLSPSTPDARRLGGAANRLGFVTSMGAGTAVVETLDIVHPRYDSSSATMDTGLELTHNTWIVLDEQGGPQILIHMISPQHDEAEIALLRSLVESIEFPGESCPSAR